MGKRAAADQLSWQAPVHGSSNVCSICSKASCAVGRLATEGTYKKVEWISSHSQSSRWSTRDKEGPSYTFSNWSDRAAVARNYFIFVDGEARWNCESSPTRPTLHTSDQSCMECSAWYWEDYLCSSSCYHLYSPLAFVESASEFRLAPYHTHCPPRFYLILSSLGAKWKDDNGLFRSAGRYPPIYSVLFHINFRLLISSLQDYRRLGAQAPPVVVIHHFRELERNKKVAFVYFTPTIH